MLLRDAVLSNRTHSGLTTRLGESDLCYNDKMSVIMHIDV
jgi:hypothetical protein